MSVMARKTSESPGGVFVGYVEDRRGQKGSDLEKLNSPDEFSFQDLTPFVPDIYDTVAEGL